ncbi:hypothetical protein HDU76_003085 [Blyttiomyces sp. JEL0837]|nr:hypothetical protein HDU76_003085 [Blyttiomyces sp. JEL0837]
MIFPRIARPLISRSPLTGVSAIRSKSTFVFAPENLAELLPKVNISGSTTLGEVWDQVYVKYQYRLAYPVLLWAGFLWYNLWNPYMKKAEKKKLKDHEDRLKKLEFHQE